MKTNKRKIKKKKVQNSDMRDCCSTEDIHYLLGHFYSEYGHEPKSFLSAVMALHDVLFRFSLDYFGDYSKAYGSFDKQFEQLYENPFDIKLIKTPRYR